MLISRSQNPIGSQCKNHLIYDNVSEIIGYCLTVEWICFFFQRCGIIMHIKNSRGSNMTPEGFLIVFFALILLVIIAAVAAVVVIVSGATAAIVEEEENEAEEEGTL